jgi:3-deoxy-D-manno-octulosonate 8-phosphate phosphatase (KDO 8-P phosphatase)
VSGGVPDGRSPDAGGPPNGLDADLARRVRLVIFDVDGVLTDGGIYVGGLPGGEGLELKRFDIQDGLGVKMLMWAGLEVAFVSGRVSEATAIRAAELGVEECHQEPDARKMPAVEDLLERKGVGWAEVAMLADDLPDLSVFHRVGLPAAVANAQPEIAERAAWRSRAPGGRGAVREFARALLVARGVWDDVVRRYVDERTPG